MAKKKFEGDRILRLPEVSRRTSLRRSAIYARMAKGDFPASIPLGGRIVGWSEAEIVAWVESLKAGRTALSSSKRCAA